MSRKLELAEIKEVIFDILVEFNKVCRENGLTVYLTGGTLLGAVRHKGFIPWDDDVDVCMPRPDYERLRKLNREGHIFPEHLKMICGEDGNFEYPFMKILDTRTVVDQKYLEDSSNSLWLDVLPVDGIPADTELAEKLYARAGRARQLLCLRNAAVHQGKSRLKAAVKPVIVPLLRLVPNHYYASRLRKTAMTYDYDRSDYVGVVVWGLYKIGGERLPKAEFETPVPVTFEGSEFRTFSCWKRYLSGCYGDYMKLPPEDQRRTHEIIAYFK